MATKEFHRTTTSGTTHTITKAMRILWCTVIILGALHIDILQRGVDSLWHFLASTWVFNCVYFETWYVVAIYPVMLLPPWLLDKSRRFDRYKLEPHVHWEPGDILPMLAEIVCYASPLMLLDTFMVKQYMGVGIDPRDWAVRKQSWIQTTRALPQEPPTVQQILWQLFASFLIYDVLFYLIHLALHKNLWLYKHLHAPHHTHVVCSSRVTNNLTMLERIILVLSANFALKAMHSHPLTRFFFVPLFVGGLIENHCGYDLPITMDKVVPFGLLGGSRGHYAHHVHGTRHYQPFFTYLDRLFHSK